MTYPKKEPLGRCREALEEFMSARPPSGGEREALIGRLRLTELAWRGDDNLNDAAEDCALAADMLAADAPKGAPTDAEIDGLWLCCSLIPGKQKEQVRDFARVLLTSYAAPGNANGIERLQAELDRLTQQKPVAWELAEKVWKDLDRQSCPGIYMQIATESIVKHCATPPAPAVNAELLERQLTTVVRWLEQNQPDVFRRGLWDAIAEEPDPPPSGEREALIYWLRERSMWDGMLRLKDAADMLAADAQRQAGDALSIKCYQAQVEDLAQQVAVPQDQYTVIGWMVGYDSRVYDKPVLGATPVYTRHAAPPQADAPEQDDDERLDEMAAMAVWEDEP